MDDSPDTTNDSSMAEKSLEHQLRWNCYSMASVYDRKFVDATILDEIAGKETNIEQCKD